MAFLFKYLLGKAFESRWLRILILGAALVPLMLAGAVAPGNAAATGEVSPQQDNGLKNEVSDQAGRRTEGAASCEEVPVWTYRIVRVLPHDTRAFTQGLIHLDGFLYESTGLLGRSTLRRIDPETGNILKSVSVPDQHFGEGLTFWGDRLIQGTWQTGVAFIYERHTMEVLDELSVFKECWGLTQDGNSLIMSDGSERLQFLDPQSFAQRSVVPVTHCGVPVRRINELEYVKGEILANIWQTDLIVRISPSTGRTLGWIDLSSLRRELGGNSGAEVLNGIAYDPETNRLFVTGKYWPKLFEIELVPQVSQPKGR